MKNINKIALSLIGVLIALMIRSREEIWYYIQPWPAWWKILIALGMGVFVTGSILHTTGLLPEFLHIFNINFQ